MMKKESTYYALLILLISGYILVELLKPEPVDWSESYSRIDEIPYGSALAYDIMNEAGLVSGLDINTDPLFEFPDDTLNRNWIFLSRSFGPDQWESEILLDKAGSGDHIFIAARNFEGPLADSLNISTRFNNPLASGNFLNGDDSGILNYVHPSLRSDSGWAYKKNSIETYIHTADTLRAAILGMNDGQQTNFVSLSYGDGKFYFHSNPAVFTNYYLREYDNAGYFLNAVKLLPDRQTIWDEYYKPGRLAGSNAMAFIVSERNLRFAWFTALTALLLFMVFRAKRKQRIIPVIEPPKNSTIEFARSVGSLYLEKGDHKTIAGKRIMFFKDHLRNDLRIDLRLEIKELIPMISERAELEENIVRDLFSKIKEIEIKDEISSDELKELNENIDRFYRLTSNKNN